MNKLFTDAEIDLAGRFVKWAMAQSPYPIDTYIQSLLSPGSQADWMGPKLTVTPNPEPQPKFWESLGRSTLGALDTVGGAHLRSFLGFSPGSSGWRNLADVGMRYAAGKALGDPGVVEQAKADFRPALAQPLARAQWQSQPYRHALSDWAVSKPFVRGLVGLSWPQVKAWATQPHDFGGMPPKMERPAPWKQPKLPPIKSTW